MQRTALPRTLCALLTSANSKVGGRLVLPKAGLGGGSSSSTLHGGFSLLPEVSRLSWRPGIQIPGGVDGCRRSGHSEAEMTAFLRQALQQVGKSQAQAGGPLLGLPSTSPCQTTRGGEKGDSGVSVWGCGFSLERGRQWARSARRRSCSTQVDPPRRPRPPCYPK